MYVWSERLSQGQSKGKHNERVRASGEQTSEVSESNTNAYCDKDTNVLQTSITKQI